MTPPLAVKEGLVEMTDAMMDAGQAYLDSKTLSLKGRFDLPATFNWHEFWRAILAAAPTFPNTGGPTEEEIAWAICKSGQYETGQGTCAAICMEALGDARKGCTHCVRVHGRAARAILKLLTEKGR